MDHTNIKQPLEDFIKNLSSIITVDNLLVFGSHASELATEDSDIDVFVISKDLEKYNEEQQFDILYKASQRITTEIHPWPATPSKLKVASKHSLLGKAQREGFHFIVK